MKRKIIGILVALGLVTTQTGCIVGLATANTPLTIAGIVLVLLGGGGGGAGQGGARVGGLSLGTIGLILDDKNPGHQDAVNAIPMDRALANSMGVSLEDIENYNDNLNQIRDVHAAISNDFRTQVIRLQKGEVKSEELSKDAEFSSVARKYGFQDGKEMIETLKGEKLSTEKLSAFANAVNLEDAQARILLETGFNVKVQ